MSSSKRDAAAIIAAASRPGKPAHDPTIAHRMDHRKALWCETQWANLSMQGKTIGLPTLPYFDPDTMLLSKEVNVKLWKQLSRLWDYLGPERAPHATPVMLEGGEVRWHSFLNGDRGAEADVYNDAVDAFMSRAKRPGEYD